MIESIFPKRYTDEELKLFEKHNSGESNSYVVFNEDYLVATLIEDNKETNIQIKEEKKDKGDLFFNLFTLFNKKA